MSDIDRLYTKHQEAFETYLKELLLWNEQFNLTAIRTPEEIKVKHFFDSLTLLPFIPKGVKTLVDVGSGAGFPGIPLAIVRPDLLVTLVESVGKKTTFLEHIVTTLGLKNVEVIYARAEEVATHPDYFESFDVGVARAVAKLDKLAGFVLPLIKKHGIFLAQKGTLENIAESENEVTVHSGKIISTETITEKDLKDRIVVIIKKT